MTSNNNTKTSKHRCRVFIKKKFLNEFKMTVWNMLNTYSWIIFDVVWTKIIRCQITCTRPLWIQLSFFWEYISTSIITPCLATAKILVYPTPPNPSQWVKQWKKVQKKNFIWVARFQRVQIFFLNPKLHFFWHFIPFLHSHLLLFRRISPWPIKKTEVLQRNVMFYPRV